VTAHTEAQRQPRACILKQIFDILLLLRGLCFLAGSAQKGHTFASSLTSIGFDT
jgi:hypothetical protein